MHSRAAYLDRLDLRRRGASLLLSVGAVGLIVLALLRLGILPNPVREPDTAPNSFSLSPERQPEANGSEAAPAERQHEVSSPAAPDRPAPEPPVEPPPPPPVPIPTAAPFPDILILDRGQFAASDIRNRRSGADEASGESGTGENSVAAYGPGEGPGGQRLYNAEWYREPSQAELAGYLPPAGAPAGSWAVIACRTVERYEVDNCRAIGESPAGSGLARAMRQAAWQFRVRPPRIGGRSVVGAWVRIRITFDQAR